MTICLECSTSNNLLPGIEDGRVIHFDSVLEKVEKHGMKAAQSRKQNESYVRLISNGNVPFLGRCCLSLRSAFVIGNRFPQRG